MSRGDVRAEGAGAKAFHTVPTCADIQHAEAAFGDGAGEIHQQPVCVPRLMALLLRRNASLNWRSCGWVDGGCAGRRPDARAGSNPS